MSATPETGNPWQIPPGVSIEPATFPSTVELATRQATDMLQQETAIKGPKVYLLHKNRAVKPALLAKLPFSLMLLCETCLGLEIPGAACRGAGLCCATGTALQCGVPQKRLALLHSGILLPTARADWKSWPHMGCKEQPSLNTGICNALAAFLPAASWALFGHNSSWQGWAISRPAQWCVDNTVHGLTRSMD